MISCSGCNIQASNVADHLDMMATIAIRNMGNCETMSDALNAYLDEHGDAIQKIGAFYRIGTCRRCARNVSIDDAHRYGYRTLPSDDDAPLPLSNGRNSL